MDKLTSSLRRPAMSLDRSAAEAEEPLMAPFRPLGKKRPMPSAAPAVTMLMTCTAAAAEVHHSICVEGSELHVTWTASVPVRSDELLDQTKVLGYVVMHPLKT